MSVTIHVGDCREVLRTLPDASVDSIVTDPPYHLTAGKKGGTGPASVNLKSPHGRSRVTTGFMGMKWDGGDVAFQPEVWAECLRVLKPGGHLLAFSGTRTYHRMACAIEDAGFEIRDQIGWAYSSGFPKSLNLDRERGDAICGCEPLEGVSAAPERDVRSVFEADVQTPFAVGGERGEVLQPGVSEQGVPTGALQRPASTNRTGELGVERRGDTLQEEGQLRERAVCASAGMGAADGEEGRLHHGAPTGDGRMVRLSPGADGGRASRRSRSDAQLAREPRTVAGQPEPQARGAWPLCRGCGKPILPRGLGTALKPAWEPICVARKPLVGTVAANVLAHGTGALNIDGCRVDANGPRPLVVSDRRNGNGVYQDGLQGSKAVGETTAGRWPANLIHDGSDEVLAAFPESTDGVAVRHRSGGKNCHSEQKKPAMPDLGYGGGGSAARFFYCAKADKDDRGEGNTHPTVKPAALMQYLCRLVTPPGGTVLDPFAGSGSTLLAADREGFNAIGIELNPEYADIARRRIHGDAPLLAEVEA